MATKLEMANCFEALRKSVTAVFEAMDNRTPEEKAQAVVLLQFMFIGIFILEDFLADVKRIADAGDGIAHEAQYGGAEK